MWQLSPGERKPVGLRRRSQARGAARLRRDRTRARERRLGVSPQLSAQLRLALRPPRGFFLREQRRADRANGALRLPWLWEVKGTPLA